MAAVLPRWLWLLVMILGAGVEGFGSDPPTLGEPAAQATPDRLMGDEAAASDARERKRKAYAGLLALLGIALTGVGLAAMVLLWGARLRRVNRQPLPAADLKDELWFLRAGKGARDAGGEANDAESREERD